MRPTDHVRRALRRAELLLGTLAVVIAVPVGVAAAGQAPPAPPVTVQAELLESSPTPEVAMVAGTAPVTARWPTPDGGSRTGLLWADAGLPRGARVMVVVDAVGGIVAERPPVEDRGLTGVLAGIGTTLICWAMLLVCVAAVRSRLAARDSNAWTAEWARVEPGWSGHTD